MNLYFRLLLLLIKRLLRRHKQTHIRQDTILHLRVLPNDLDLNCHMNNGRYLTIMDLGRIDYMIKNGLLTPVLRNKWFPVISAAHMCYFRPLNLFNAYKLRTTLESWDDKWYIITQRFEKNGKIYAIGVVRGLFRDKKGSIPMPTILKHLNLEHESPPRLFSEAEMWLSYLSHKKAKHFNQTHHSSNTKFFEYEENTTKPKE